MSNNHIYILSADIHQGKTTALFNWVKNKTNVFGILTPDIYGKRYFMDIETSEKFEMEADPYEENTQDIGRFKFSDSAFKKANGILKNSLLQKNGWIIIDEVGPLELKQKGFHNIIKEIFSTKDLSLNILLVVRKPLLQEVIQFYGLNSNEIILLNPEDDFFKA